jgi:endo-1,4-beta-xylanase
MSRLWRLVRILTMVALVVVAVVAVIAVGSIYIAPGRGGLAGADDRARSWGEGPPLRELADRIGVRFGSAVMVRDMRADPAYSPVLGREFNSVTPFVEMKWGTLHPEPDRYDFTMADELVAFAETHDMRVRGHTLVYGQCVDPPNPAYLAEMTDPDALRRLMSDHVRTVAGRYAGRIEAWDVVNEPLLALGDPTQGDGLSQHVFSKVLGPGYIAEALHLARQADPDAQLFLNEFGALNPGFKQDRYYRLVQDLLDEEAPLDAVGFQGHIVPLFGGTASRDGIEATLRRFAALGVAVEITELNVFTRTLKHVLTLGLSYDEQVELRRQADAYTTVTEACLAVPECQGVTLWTFTDRYPTTIETLTRLEDIPLIFDDDYHPKPAAFALREVLEGATPRRPPTPGPDASVEQEG